MAGRSNTHEKCRDAPRIPPKGNDQLWEENVIRDPREGDLFAFFWEGDESDPSGADDHFKILEVISVEPHHLRVLIHRQRYASVPLSVRASVLEPIQLHAVTGNPLDLPFNSLDKQALHPVRRS